MRSDLERKALFRVDPQVKLPEDAYRPGVSEKVYERILAQAGQVLRAHHSVILELNVPSYRLAHAKKARPKQSKEGTKGGTAGG